MQRGLSACELKGYPDCRQTYINAYLPRGFRRGAGIFLPLFFYIFPFCNDIFRTVLHLFIDHCGMNIRRALAKQYH